MIPYDFPQIPPSVRLIESIEDPRISAPVPMPLESDEDGDSDAGQEEYVHMPRPPGRWEALSNTNRRRPIPVSAAAAASTNTNTPESSRVLPSESTAPAQQQPPVRRRPWTPCKRCFHLGLRCDGEKPCLQCSIRTVHCEWEFPEDRLNPVSCAPCQSAGQECRGAFPCVPCQERGLRAFCTARPGPSSEALPLRSIAAVTLPPLHACFSQLSLPSMAASTPETTPAATPTSSPLPSSAPQLTAQATPPTPTPTTPSGSRAACNSGPSSVPGSGPLGGQEQLPSFPSKFGSTSVPILPPLPPQVAYHEEAAKAHDYPGFTPDILQFMTTLVPLGQPIMVRPAKPHPLYCFRWGILQKVYVPAAEFRNRLTYIPYTSENAPPDGLHLADIVYYEYSPVPPPLGVLDPDNFMAGSDDPPLPIPEAWLPRKRRRTAQPTRIPSAPNPARTSRTTRRHAPY